MLLGHKIAFGLALGLALGGCATASTDQPLVACPASATESKSVPFKGQNQEFFQGMSGSLQLGMLPSSFPTADIADNSAACHRGLFTVNEIPHVAFGGDNDSPPRWALGPDATKIAFLAVIPPPSAGLRWVKNPNAEFSFTEPPMFVLAVTNGNRRDIFGVFDQIPGDEQLKGFFAATLEGRLPKLATFNVATRETVFADR